MDLLIAYALTFIGTPYKWGGRHPAEGLDCSEYVQIVLRSAGELEKKDYTAQDLYDWAMTNGTPNRYAAGALCFYGKAPNKVTHVAFAIDQYRMIEAGGGGSDCNTLEDAICKKAMVRIRLIKERSDFIAIVKPRYSRIGLM